MHIRRMHRAYVCEWFLMHIHAHCSCATVCGKSKVPPLHWAYFIECPLSLNATFQTMRMVERNLLKRVKPSENPRPSNQNSRTESQPAFQSWCWVLLTLSVFFRMFVCTCASITQSIIRHKLQCIYAAHKFDVKSHFIHSLLLGISCSCNLLCLVFVTLWTYLWLFTKL